MGTRSVDGVDIPIQEYQTQKRLEYLDRFKVGMDMMQDYWGNPNQAIQVQANACHDHANDDILWRDLWAAWEGDHFEQSEMFVSALTSKGGELMKLFPVMWYEEATRKYNWRRRGEVITFNQWEFGTGRMPTKGKRTPGMLLESIRSMETQQTFRHTGVGGNFPLDFMSDPTKLNNYAMFIKQVEQNVRETWAYQVVDTMVRESKSYKQRLAKRAIGTYGSVGVQERLHYSWDLIGALQKNGKGFVGMEDQVYQDCLTRNVHVDSVLTTAGTAHFLYARRHFSYAENGTDVHPGSRAKRLDTEGAATTPLHRLRVFESRRFPSPNTPEPHDPMVETVFISQRFSMLPGVVDIEVDSDYKSRSRHIAIVDANVFVSREITLLDALGSCGLFNTIAGATGNAGVNSGVRVNRMRQRIGVDDTIPLHQITHTTRNKSSSEFNSIMGYILGRDLNTDENVSAYDLYQSAGLLGRIEGKENLVKAFQKYVDLNHQTEHGPGYRSQSRREIKFFGDAKYKSNESMLNHFIRCLKHDLSCASMSKFADCISSFPHGERTTFEIYVYGGLRTDNTVNGVFVYTENDVPSNIKYDSSCREGLVYHVYIPLPNITMFDRTIVNGGIVHVSTVIKNEHNDALQSLSVITAILCQQTDINVVLQTSSTFCPPLTEMKKLEWKNDDQKFKWASPFLPDSIATEIVHCLFKRAVTEFETCPSHSRPFLAESGTPWFLEATSFHPDIDQIICNDFKSECEVHCDKAKKKTSSTIDSVLKQISIRNYSFWEFIVRENIVFPMSFLLFRMHLQIDVGSVIFFKRGGDTGVMCIKDCGVTFARNVATFTLNVGVRMTSNTIIVRPENLEIVPHVFIKRYRRGGGVRMYNPSDENDINSVTRRTGENRRDIFCVAVPYNHVNHTSYTDITGNLAREIMSNDGIDDMYATAPAYKKIWKWDEPNQHALDYNRDVDGTGARLTVCAQSSQFEYNHATKRCDILVSGVCPMGPQADPHNYRIVLGGEMLGYSGSGFEGSRPSPIEFRQ